MLFNPRRIICCIVTLSTVLNIPLALAGTVGSDQHDASFVLSLGGGPVWDNTGKTQSFYLQPDIENTYFAIPKTNTLANVELFLGVQRAINSDFQGRLGIEVATTSKASITGQVWADADPTLNNFNYAYQVRNTRITAKGWLLRNTTFHTLKPYINGGLGIGFNEAENFNTVPIIFQAIPGPNFKSKTTTALSFTAGAGIQKNINAHWQASVGYEFADWGASKLARAPGQTLGDGLFLSHLYTNGVLVNFTYLT